LNPGFSSQLTFYDVAINIRQSLEHGTRQWERTLIPSADGTGGIAKRVDGVRMFLDGVAMRSPVSAEPTVMRPPLPAIIWVAWHTGKTADAFATNMLGFQEMCHHEMGYAVPPPPGMMTDMDRCFLNAMCRLWANKKDYNSWLQFAWKLAVEAYRLFEDTIASLTAAAAAQEMATSTAAAAISLAAPSIPIAAAATTAASDANTAGVAAFTSNATTSTAAVQLGHGPILVPISCFQLDFCTTLPRPICTTKP
jgi:hypothetical protein